MFKGGMGNIMKQAQQMQEKMQEAQAELAKQETTGEAGAGLVKITLNGKFEAKKVEIDTSILDDKEMLEDLVSAAINDSVHKVNEINSSKMSGIGSSMGLPDGMKLPF